MYFGLGEETCGQEVKTRVKSRFVNMTTLADRFWSKVKKGPMCWLWTGAAKSTGYGVISVNGKVCLAHRVSYELNVGPIPAGLFVCHRCNTPACVNPAHIYAGTARQNAGDMIKRWSAEVWLPRMICRTIRETTAKWAAPERFCSIEECNERRERGTGEFCYRHSFAHLREAV